MIQKHFNLLRHLRGKSLTMFTRRGSLLVTSLALAMLTVGCQSRTGTEGANSLKPLSAKEAAEFRQVDVTVSGMT